MRLGVRRGSGLAVGLVDDAAWYPHTAKFLQFGGRFDSEGVALARIHILLLSWATLRCGWCLGPGGGRRGGGSGRSRAGDEQAVGRIGQSGRVLLPVAVTGVGEVDGWILAGSKGSVCGLRVVEGSYMGSRPLVFRTCRATLAERSTVHTKRPHQPRPDSGRRALPGFVTWTWRRTKRLGVYTNGGTSNSSAVLSSIHAGNRGSV